MQNAIAWWCNLIGVSDPAAIQVAVGVVAGGIVMMIITFVVSIIVRASFSN